MLTVKGYLIFLNVTALFLTLISKPLFAGIVWWCSRMATASYPAIFTVSLIWMFFLSIVWLLVSYFVGLQPKCKVQGYHGDVA